MTSLFLSLASLVAVGALYATLGAVGVIDSVNGLVGELTSDTSGVGSAPLLSVSRVLGVTALLGVLNVVLLTLLATLTAALYNVVASFTGGIEVTLTEREG